MFKQINNYITSNNVLTGITKLNLATSYSVKSVLPFNLPRVNKNYIVGFIDSHIIHYPSPISLTYAWSFGSLAGLCLVIQMISGIFLGMHYTPHVELAFSSIEHIMRDVNNGWLIRYVHANGASMFFILVYSHICRGLYYGSYIEPREHLWCSGVLILFLMMGTAFTGYVLPWGQMSFWGATVISNMVTAIPVAGQPIVQWLWGGYTVDNPTLNRFFSIHFVLPFLIAGLTIVHLALLHKDGSNNPVGSDTGIDDLPFYPYFAVKDIFAFFCFMLFFAIFVFYFPNILNHPDNCIPADPLQTPAHVVPEWYERVVFTDANRAEKFIFLKYFTNVISLAVKVLRLIAQLFTTLSGTMVLLAVELYHLVEPLYKKFLVLLTCCFVLKRCSSDILNYNFFVNYFYLLLQKIIIQNRIINRLEYGAQIHSIYANFYFYTEKKISL